MNDKTIELLQQIFFEVCDLQSGDSYSAIGYDSRADWLDDVKMRLAEAETRLAGEHEAAA